MSSKKSDAYPPQVCLRLDKIVEARDQEKAREQELIRTRKSLKDDLLELGRGSTKRHLEVSRDYVVTMFGLEASRNRQKSLSDLMDKTVKEAHQATLIDVDADDGIDVRELDEKVIFETLRATGAGGESDDQDQPDLPIGEANGKATNSEARAKNDGYIGPGLWSPELAASVRDLDIEPKIADKLIAAKIITIGDLMQLDESPGGIDSLDSLTGPQAAKVRAALKSWRKNQNAAELEESRAAG